MVWVGTEEEEEEVTEVAGIMQAALVKATPTGVVFLLIR